MTLTSSPIRPETVTKLGAVVEAMDDALAGGGDPRDVLRKSAADEDLTADQVRLCARMYNVGVSNGRRKAAGLLGSLADSRTKADFDAVDPEPIVAGLFDAPARPKAAAFHGRDVSELYAGGFVPPEHRVKAAEAERAGLVDRTLDELAGEVKAPKLAFVNDAAQLAPWNWYKVQQHQHNNALDKFAAAQAAALDRLWRVGEYFLDLRPDPAKVAFADFRARAETLFGPPAKVLLDKVAARLPRGMAKAAARADLSDASAGPYRLLEDTLAAFGAWQEARDGLAKAAEQLEKAYAKVPKGTAPKVAGSRVTTLLGHTQQQIARVKHAATLTGMDREAGLEYAVRRSSACGGRPKSGRSVLPKRAEAGSDDDKEGEPAAPKLGNFGTIFGASLGAGVGREIGSHIPGAAPIEKLQESAYGQLTDPDHERELAGIQAESMLSQLLNADPVLANQDPDAVLENYNELSQTYPNAMSQPAIARSLLRQIATTGGLTPFDLEQLARLNNTGARPAPKPAAPQGGV